MFSKKTYRGIGAAAAAALALTGCGGGASEDSGAAGGMTELRVGVLPNIDTLALYLGVENGVFEEHGLSVEPVPAQGGAALLPAVLEGSVDITYSNVLTHMQAMEKGLPTEMVSGAPLSHDPSVEEPTYDHPASILAVTKDSEIDSVRDLAGKTVSVNSLGNIQELAVRNSIDSGGGDSSKVKLIELPLSQAQGALEGDRIDAASVNDPFTTAILEAGHRSIASPFTDFEHSASNIAVYFSTDQFAEENAEALERFRAALTEINTYINENPDQARDGLGLYTRIDEDLRADVTLPYYTTQVNRASIEEIMTKAVEYGLLDAELPIDDVIGVVPTLEDEGQ